MQCLETASGEKHGLVNTLPNSVKDTGFAHMTPEMKAQCEKLRKEDSRKVKARYINHNGNHERLSKPYCHWAGENIQMWHLIPGEVYELPMGFVNEVNASGMPIRSEIVDANGVPTLKDGKKRRTHELVSISF